MNRNCVILAYACLAIFIPLINGCAILKDASRAAMEERYAVQEDQVLHETEGLYEARVPAHHMYALFDAVGAKSLIICHRDLGGFLMGPYYVIPWHPDAIPSESRGSLESAFNSSVGQFFQQKFPDRLEILKLERIDWNGAPALYHELFIPGDIRNRGPNTTVVYMNNFGYAGIFAKKGPFFFWITHCDPIDQKLVEKEQLKIKQTTRDTFKKFLEGVTLLPEHTEPE